MNRGLSDLNVPASDPTPRWASLKDDAAQRDGIALCLSGGGYRAMLFHLGTLWRLNEAGAMRKLARVSSVSGGSITAGVLGLRWTALDFDASSISQNFVEQVVTPVRRLADRTLDAGAVIGGLLLPGTIADRMVGYYQRHLFGDATLQDLPADDQGPRFIINATNVMSGALWRFSKPYMGDYRVGRQHSPRCLLATAVAASSAFPPVLSPLTLDLDPAKMAADAGNDLHRLPYTDTAILSDGGVYDNLGLETAFKAYRTLLVSDAGQQMSPEPDPAGDWAQHSIRVMGLLDHQVRNLRKRQLIGSYLAQGPDARDGAYWSIRSSFADYADPASPFPDPLGLAGFDPSALAGVPTRLKSLDAPVQERLINWGYASCDTALRRHAAGPLGTYGIALRDPVGLPYPGSPL